MRTHLSLLFLGLSCAVAGACGSNNHGFIDSGDAGSSGGSSGGFGSGSTSSGSSSGSGSSGGASGSGSSPGSFGDAGGLPDASQPVSGDPATCGQAAQSHSYIGCDYWPTVTANTAWSVFDFAVVVANAGTDTANVTVTGPGGVNQTGSAPPGQLTTLYLPWVSDLKGADMDNCGAVRTPLSASVLSRGAAYHLVSSVPVTVYQFSALEYVGQGGPPSKDWSSCPGNTVCQMVGAPVGCYSFTNDASLLLPSTALTGNVRVTGHEGQTYAPTFAAITATADNTTVKVTVSSTGAVQASSSGDIASTNAGGTLTLTMNSGDVAELVGAASDSSDLSGSLVQANNPVQVITGSACHNIPDNALACDHIEESNFPAETLGQDYFVVQPVGPNGDVVGHQVRIYGNFDGTNLTYSPSAPPNCPSTINAGQVVECGATMSKCTDPNNPFGGSNQSCGQGNVVTQDFEVKGDKSFAVATFSLGAMIVDPGTMPPNQQGDPDESMATAVKQYRTKYVFLAPTDYKENYAVVIAPAGTTVSIDGTAATATATPIASSGYGAMRIQLGVGNAGAHVLTASNPVGLQVMGYGSYTSYTYPGGSDLALIAPPPPVVQ